MAHVFGGAWTETKLGIVAEYAKAFQTALKNQQFKTWYIDPFAGSGERTERRLVGGLLDGSPVKESEVSFSGSAKRALQINPPFHHYRFADTKAEHVQALRRIASEHPHYDISVWPGDGNGCVRDVLSSTPWIGPASWCQRGIVFLDPYGMAVTWDTLQRIANTKRLDVWFLFATKAVRQQLGPSLDRVDEGKGKALDRFFGEEKWRTEFFRPVDQQTDLFGFDTEKSETAVNLRAIGAYARKRFRDAFCWVSEAKSLTVNSVPDYFQLYCMTNNDSAKGLIQRLHSGVVKAHERASHQKFSH